MLPYRATAMMAIISMNVRLDPVRLAIQLKPDTRVARVRDLFRGRWGLSRHWEEEREATRQAAMTHPQRSAPDMKRRSHTGSSAPTQQTMGVSTHPARKSTHCTGQ